MKNTCFREPSEKIWVKQRKQRYPLQRWPQDGDVALIASADYDQGDEVDNGTVDNGTVVLLVNQKFHQRFCWKVECFFFEVYCVETKMMFFPTILSFKFRVIAQVILSKKILISDSSERFTFSTRELHLDSRRASELMFCCIDQGQHHMKLAPLMVIQG